MKQIATLLILSILATAVTMAHPSYSEGRKINESLSKAFSSIYDIKRIETDTFAETNVGDYKVSRTTYFYEWKKEEFAEKKEEELIERLEPWIKSLENKYEIWCQNRGFMSSKHADDFTPTKIPGLNLVFKNRETKEVHLHLMISIFIINNKLGLFVPALVTPMELCEEESK